MHLISKKQNKQKAYSSITLLHILEIYGTCFLPSFWVQQDAVSIRMSLLHYEWAFPLWCSLGHSLFSYDSINSFHYHLPFNNHSRPHMLVIGKHQLPLVLLHPLCKLHPSCLLTPPVRPPYSLSIPVPF